MRSILAKLEAEYNNTEARRNVVNVERDDVLDGRIRAFMRVSFNPAAELSVRFAGEDGIDDGGRVCPSNGFVQW